jgi:hypothetical protein
MEGSLIFSPFRFSLTTFTSCHLIRLGV